MLSTVDPEDPGKALCRAFEFGCQQCFGLIKRYACSAYTRYPLQTKGSQRSPTSKKGVPRGGLPSEAPGPRVMITSPCANWICSAKTVQLEGVMAR